MNKIHHVLYSYDHNGNGLSITVYRQYTTRVYPFKWWYADKFTISKHFKYSWHESSFMLLY